MAKIIGIGGIFLKTRDSHVLRPWYAKHLDVDIDNYGCFDGIMDLEK